MRSRDPARRPDRYWRSLFESAPVPVAHLEAVRDPEGGIVDFTFRNVNLRGATAAWPGEEAVEEGHSLAAVPEVGEQRLHLIEACRNVVRTRELYEARNVPVSTGSRDVGDADAYLDVFASVLDDGVVLVWVVTGSPEVGPPAAGEESRERARLHKHLEMMRHELRNVLNSMLGFCDLLHTGISGPLNERQKEHIGRVYRAGRHLGTLVEDSVASLQAAEAGVPVRREEVDLKQVVGDVVAMMHPEAERQGLTLGSSCPDSPPTIRTDGDKLRQILSNLVGNALKYTEEGRIRVEVDAPDDDSVRIRVRDSGPGIPPDQREKIFQPYVRLDPGEATGRSGSGLGLSLCRHLGRRLGGTVELEGSSPEEGSVFAVRLPRRGGQLGSPPADDTVP